jgi:hypothetical protein
MVKRSTARTATKSKPVNKIEAELNVIKAEVGNLKQSRTGTRRFARANLRRRRNVFRTTVAARRAAGRNSTATRSSASRPITTIGRILRSGGALAGSYFGNPTLGSTIGAGISRIFGQGDYQVTHNSLCHGGPPSFASLNTGMRVSHREYVSDVLGSIAFTNTTYQITPTNQQLFPWLSKLAYNFEEFKIHGLVFYFNTTCGSAISSTNNALGVIGMTTVYDPSDPDLASKREAEDYGGCVAGVPSSSLLHPVECKPRSNVLDRQYVQVSPVTDPDDLKFYSHGKLNIFTQGMQINNVNIGELWVSYDIEFFNPKILPIGSVGAAASKISGTVTDMTGSQIYGTATIPQTTGNLGCFYEGVSGRIVIPSGTASGYYYVSDYGSTGSSTYTADYRGASSNITFVNYFQGASTAQICTPNAATANPWHGMGTLFYKSDAKIGYIQGFVTSGIIATSHQFDVTIVKVPSSLLGIPDSTVLMAKPDDKQLVANRVVEMLKNDYVLDLLKKSVLADMPMPSRIAVIDESSPSESEIDSEEEQHFAFEGRS